MTTPIPVLSSTDYLKIAEDALEKRDLFNFSRYITLARIDTEQSPSAGTEAKAGDSLREVVELEILGLYTFGQYKEALQRIEEIILYFPELDFRVTLLRRKVIILTAARRYEEGITVLETILAEDLPAADSSILWAVVNLSWLYLQQHQEGSDISHLTKAAELCEDGLLRIDGDDDNENRKPLLVNLGKVYFSLEEYEKAYQTFQAARKCSPEDSNIILGLAIAALELYRLKDAQRYLKIARKTAQKAGDQKTVCKTFIIEARIAECIFCNYTLAKEHLTKAHDQYLEIHAFLEAFYCYEDICRLEDKINNPSLVHLFAQLKELFAEKAAELVAQDTTESDQSTPESPEPVNPKKPSVLSRLKVIPFPNSELTLQ